ncbi:MAG: four helix bundle protein [Prevotella sp.]|jgi:hypothetical protein|nr:four helix bundle protein [Prevotella sp.]
MIAESKLPLYRDLFNLLNGILDMCKSYSKFFKMTVGERTVKECLDLMALFLRARNVRKNTEIVEEMDAKFEMVLVLFRAGVQQRVISEAQYARFAVLLANVGAQIADWRRECHKRDASGEI